MVYMQPKDGEQQPNSKFNGDPNKMFLAKYSHYSPKPTHNEQNKNINLRMILCGLNKKERL